MPKITPISTKLMARPASLSKRRLLLLLLMLLLVLA
jgi:hypothetical protein